MPLARAPHRNVGGQCAFATAALAVDHCDNRHGIRRGIEKESLRALPDGGLALTPHPRRWARR
jgi:gamma-glutamylcysteine synthetase